MPKVIVYHIEEIPVFSSDLEAHEFWNHHKLSAELEREHGRYPERVQEVIDQLVEMAEAAENANRHSLSGWYGSVCRWVREREKGGLGFTLTLPDPDEAGDPLTTIEVQRRP